MRGRARPGPDHQRLPARRRARARRARRGGHRLRPRLRAARAWPPPGAVLDALQAARARGARIASICTGAFALGAAGLLDGRRVTTHWRHAARLAELYPRAQRRSRRALRRRGRPAHLRRRRRRHRPVPAPAAPRPRRRGRQRRRPPDGRRAAPRRRPGAVHRARRPADDDGSLEATRAYALAAPRPSRSPSRSSPRHACTSERTFNRRFRAGDRHDAAQVAARAARRPRAPAAGGRATCRSRRSRSAAASARRRSCASTSAARPPRRRPPTGAPSPGASEARAQRAPVR